MKPIKYRRRRGTVLPFVLRMKIHTQQLEVLPIEAIRPHPENPRRGDVVAIAESIVQNGFYGAVVVQKSTGYILVGNHRWQAAKGVGASTIPCIKIDVTDEDAMRIMLADNRTAELGGYDEVALRAAIESVSETALGLAGTGYRQEEIDAILGLAPDAAGSGVPMSDDEAHDSHEQLNAIRWGKTRVHLTDDELARWESRYRKYVERTGLEFGFIAHILETLEAMDEGQRQSDPPTPFDENDAGHDES